MWVDCPRILDEPVKIYGLELDDCALIAVLPLFLSLVCDALPSFGGAAVLGMALYFAKRGKAAGALLHQLHALELARLPGLLSPRRQRYSPW